MKLNIRIMAVLAFLMLFAVVSASAEEPLKGDFNLNGRLDFADVTGLFNYLGTGPYLPYMDMNNNGRLDFNDVVVLFNTL